MAEESDSDSADEMSAGERLQDSVDVAVGGNRRTYLVAAVVVLAVLVIGAFYIGDVFQQPAASEQSDTDDTTQEETFTDYADASEDTGSTDVEETAEIHQTFNIHEYGITPASTEIGVGGAVEFVNDNDFTVRLEFDRTSQTPTLDPGESVQMKFRGITYFTAYEHEEDREIGTGKINVQ